jgi:hypothetical protein
MHNGVNIRDLNGVEASTSQVPLIGYTAFWRLAGIRVSHPDLERALQTTGFDKYLPNPPTPRVALRRALAEWIKTKQRISRYLQLHQDDEDQDGNGGSRRRTLIRVINRAALTSSSMHLSPRTLISACSACLTVQRCESCCTRRPER